MSDSQNSSDRKQADKITQLQIKASRGKTGWDFRVVGRKAKSTTTEVKAGATDTEDKAMDPTGRASSHKGLLLGLETYRNLPCWVSKLLGTDDPFLPLNFSLLEWKCL